MEEYPKYIFGSSNVSCRVLKALMGIGDTAYVTILFLDLALVFQV